MKTKIDSTTAAGSSMAERGARPGPVTVSRFLPDGRKESFTIENPPRAFRVDWERKVAIPVEPRTAQGRPRAW